MPRRVAVVLLLFLALEPHFAGAHTYMRVSGKPAAHPRALVLPQSDQSTQSANSSDSTYRTGGIAALVACGAGVAEFFYALSLCTYDRFRLQMEAKEAGDPQRGESVLGEIDAVHMGGWGAVLTGLVTLCAIAQSATAVWLDYFPASSTTKVVLLVVGVSAAVIGLGLLFAAKKHRSANIQRIKKLYNSRRDPDGSGVIPSRVAMHMGTSNSDSEGSSSSEPHSESQGRESQCQLEAAKRHMYDREGFLPRVPELFSRYMGVLEVDRDGPSPDTSPAVVQGRVLLALKCVSAGAFAHTDRDVTVTVGRGESYTCNSGSETLFHEIAGLSPSQVQQYVPLEHLFSYRPRRMLAEMCATKPKHGHPACCLRSATHDTGMCARLCRRLTQDLMYMLV